VDYEVWDAFAEGRAPTFEELRNYQVVIWRNGEFFSSLGTAEIRALRDYVDAGGGLFMASMELLTRLDEGGSTTSDARSSVWRIMRWTPASRGSLAARASQ
jgi:hypothetical protein